MPSKNPQRLLSAAAICYRRLLALYPKPFREEFGGEMTLLFREQCRAALERKSALAFPAFALRTLFDLIRSSIVERLHSLKSSLRSKDGLAYSVRPEFLKWAAAGLCLAAVAGAVMTTQPRFAALARLEVQMPRPSNLDERRFLQTQMELIQSQAVLMPLIEDHLNQTFRIDSGLASEMTAEENLAYLRKRLRVNLTEGSSLIEIHVSFSNPRDAAHIANAIAKSYYDWTTRPQLEARLADPSQLDELFAAEKARPKPRVLLVDAAAVPLRASGFSFSAPLLAAVLLGILLLASGFFLGWFYGRRPGVQPESLLAPQTAF